MNLPSLDTWIAGRRETTPEPAGDFVNPNTGDVLAPLYSSSAEQVERAVASAAAAHEAGVGMGAGAGAAGGGGDFFDDGEIINIVEGSAAVPP